MPIALLDAGIDYTVAAHVELTRAEACVGISEIAVVTLLAAVEDTVAAVFEAAVVVAAAAAADEQDDNQHCRGERRECATVHERISSWLTGGAIASAVDADGARNRIGRRSSL